MSEALKKFEVYGLSAKYFFPAAIIAIAAVYLGWLTDEGRRKDAALLQSS